MKILAVLPTIYPEKMDKMCESMNLTKSKYTDFTFCSEGTVTEAINIMFNANPDYDFYMILNDDIEFMTPLWDIKLTQNKGNISYGDDLLQGKNLCTFPMLDGDIARAVGWLQLPTLNKFCGDVVWRTIGQSLNILEYHPEVIIKHHWEGCSNDLIHKEDVSAFARWLQVSHKDINKIREALCL